MNPITATCDGTSSTIVTNRQCTIPMTTFTADPFLLSPLDLIVVTIEAKNTLGYSPPSDENTSGANVQTAPNEPSTVVTT